MELFRSPITFPDLSLDPDERTVLVGLVDTLFYGLIEPNPDSLGKKLAKPFSSALGLGDVEIESVVRRIAEKLRPGTRWCRGCATCLIDPARPYCPNFECENP